MNTPLAKRYAEAFVRAEKETGFPAEVGFSMGALESGWFLHETAQNNVFGITYRPKMEEKRDLQICKLCWTREYCSRTELFNNLLPEEYESAAPVTIPRTPNQKVWWRVMRYFRAFASPEAAVIYYVRLIIEAPRYSKAMQTYNNSAKLQKDKENLIWGIQQAGYSTGDAATEEVKIMKQDNVAVMLREARENG